MQDVTKHSTARKQSKADWHHLYGTKAWQALRLATFERDLFICQTCGILCTGKHPAPNSPVADHIIPHKGDTALFWQVSNVRTLCKRDHDAAKQREEIRGYSTEIDESGWPTDGRHPANRA